MKTLRVLPFLLVFFVASKTSAQDSTLVEDKPQLKNAIRADLYGKSVLYGIAYDRIVYSKGKIDWHANVAWHEPPYISSDFYSFGCSFYATVDKFKVNPLFGIGFTHYFTREVRGISGGTIADTYSVPLLLLGGRIKIAREWDLQIHYSPTFSYHIFRQEDSVFEPITIKEWTPELMWGGLSVGYHF